MNWEKKAFLHAIQRFGQQYGTFSKTSGSLGFLSTQLGNWDKAFSHMELFININQILSNCLIECCMQFTWVCKCIEIKQDTSGVSTAGPMSQYFDNSIKAKQIGQLAWNLLNL